MFTSPMDATELDPDLSVPEGDDPIAVFAKVFAEAKGANIALPEAVTLATADRDGRPSARMVLLKDFDARGFVFYTNSHSRKGRELADNPYACLSFHWKELRKQVIIRGPTQLVGAAEADAYFATRPRASQLGAWASQQSEPMPSRAHLIAAVAKVEARHLGRPVPRPEHWNGYRLAPETMEFWADGSFRIHARRRYERDATGRWHSELLYP